MNDLLRVLLVEDNPGDADLIVEMLSREGSTRFEVECVARLSEAFECIGEKRFDIILLDLGLPDSDGLATLRAVRRRAPQLPIIVLTGINDERMALTAIHEGAQDYLIKGQPDTNLLVRSIKYAVERKKAKEALTESEEKYRGLFESSLDAIMTLEPPSWKFTSANPATVKMFGAKNEGEFISLGPWKLSPDRQSDGRASDEKANELIETAMREGAHFCEWTHRRIGGEVFYADVLLTRMEQRGKVILQASVRDTTGRRKLEDQLRQAQKMESIGTLAGGIAHDFNNILTAIMGYGHIALMKMEPDDPLRLNLEHMLGGCDRAAHLTKDLLIFSRKQISEKSPVDLNEIIRKVEKFLVRVIGEDINFSLALQSEPIVANADTHQLEQVLMNLATNARDAMPEGGDLIISAEKITVGNDFTASHGYGKPGRYALLTISDTGLGMDAVTLKNIFEPFFTTKEVGKGTGLGLAVVYGIIKQHDGFINVYSEPGAGTTFKIYLPVISSEVLREEIAQEEESLAQGTETILLAEDDVPVRNLVRSVLEKQGYAVIEAVDGADAVKKFMDSTKTIHLLLSDLIMPFMNGNVAYDEMKKKQPGLKVIFASGYAPDFVRQKMLLEKNVAQIYKPISPHALLKKVRTVLDEGEK